MGKPGSVNSKRLSPECLAEQFGRGSDVADEGVGALYEALVEVQHPEVAAALGRWKTLFAEACGHDPDRPSAAVEQLAKGYGISPEGLRPAEMLFAVHTYYALVVKLLVWQIAASSCKLSEPCRQLASAGDDVRLKKQMEGLESGSLLGAWNLVDFAGDDPFAWYLHAWNRPVGELIRRLAAGIGRYDSVAPIQDPAGNRDLLGTLYQDLFPKQVRHALGEYYTPDWLAEHVLDEVGYAGDTERRLLDPACGSGTFLVQAIRRIRARYEQDRPSRHQSEGELCRKILTGVVGFDLNPVAVLAARANYLIAIADLLPHVGRVRIPVFLRDSILADSDGAAPGGGPFDYVVGNPPWIVWDHLPAEYRQATRSLWERYGLFSLSASEARHGGGKKDLSMLMVYASVDRYLKGSGRLAMVITQTVFQTKGAGDGFRRFRLGSDGPWLGVVRVHDMVDCKPFPAAANWTATIVLEKGRRTVYPVPYIKWSPCGEPPQGDGRPGRPSFRQRRYEAQPIDPNRESSPWFVRPQGLKLEVSRFVGPSDYQAHLGANSGGANGVYWVELLEKTDRGVLVRNMANKGKRSLATVQQVVEPDLLYPLLRWSDVARYRAVPSAHLLLAQDVQTRKGIDLPTMGRRYPKTYAYLKQFAAVLADRAAYKRYQQEAAFYSMYNVGPYTVAPLKVVWRRMDRRINAAVVEVTDDPVLGPRSVVPQETCVLIAVGSAAEADYVVAVLNSSMVGFLVTSHSVRGGKGFGTPGMLDFIRLGRFDPGNSLHGELSTASRQAHEAVGCGEDVTQIQRCIDLLAGRLWGLDQSEVDLIGRELEG